MTFSISTGTLISQLPSYTGSPASLLVSGTVFPYTEDKFGSPITKVLSAVQMKEMMASQFQPSGTYVALSANSPRVYNTSGTWSKPTGLVYVLVEVVGAGGGGGGCTAGSGTAAVANGGGGGAYKMKRINASSLGATEAVTVGAGGAGGAAGNNNGSDGSASSFGAHVVAGGGSGGNGAVANATVPLNGTLAGGAGADTTGALGDINIPGSPALGGIKWSTSAVQSSVGGASHLSASVHNTVSSGDDADGLPGSPYGGGGSGAQSTNDTTNRAGGAGANGVVIVWEYVSV